MLGTILYTAVYCYGNNLNEAPRARNLVRGRDLFRHILDNLLQWLVPPVPPGRPTQRLRISLFVVLVTFIGASILVAMSEPILRIKVITSGCILFTLICGGFLYAGKLTLPRLGLPIMLFIAFTLFAATGEGVFGIAPAAFPLVTGVSMLLLGSGATVVSALSCSVAVLAIAYAQMQGLVESPMPGVSTFPNAIQLVIIHAALLMVLLLIRRYADQDLNLIQQSETNLRTKNEELEEQKKALEASETRYRLLADNVSDVVWTMDMEFNQTYCSPSVFQQRGFTAEELGKLSLNEQISEDTLDTLVGAFREELEYARGQQEGRRDASRVFEYKVRCKDGSEKWVEAVIAFLYDDDGKPNQLIGISRDIAERKRAEEEKESLQLQVQQMQKMESLGMLAGGIAHDFNNLLTGIMGNADLALSHLPQETKGRKYVSDVIASAQRAAELCQQLLAYSGRGRFVVRPVNLSELVEEMAPLLEVSTRKAGNISYSLADGLPAIEADLTQLRQIVVNLIINAADAIEGHEDGAIAVSTGVSNIAGASKSGFYLSDDIGEGDYVWVNVADTGAGMNEETRERIFDPFFTTKSKGHGLGLAAVLGIVRGHNGAVRVESSPGEGTSIRIYFPASMSEAAPLRLAESAAAQRNTPCTVLVVDDEEIVRDVLDSGLTESGHCVLTAEDGASATELFKERSGEIDVVILDMTMPGMDGVQTFRALQKIQPGVRVILASGYSEQEAVSRFDERAPAGFIQKPFLIDDILALIQSALDRSSETS